MGIPTTPEQATMALVPHCADLQPWRPAINKPQVLNIFDGLCCFALTLSVYFEVWFSICRHFSPSAFLYHHKSDHMQACASTHVHRHAAHTDICTNIHTHLHTHNMNVNGFALPHYALKLSNLNFTTMKYMYVQRSVCALLRYNALKVSLAGHEMDAPRDFANWRQTWHELAWQESREPK